MKKHIQKTIYIKKDKLKYYTYLYKHLKEKHISFSQFVENIVISIASKIKNKEV